MFFSFDIVQLLRNLPDPRLLNANERLFLIVLGSYIGSNSHAFPHQERLAEACGFSVATVKRVISSLIKKDLITVTKNATKKGVQNLYSYGQTLIKLIHSLFEKRTRQCDDMPLQKEGGQLNLISGVSSDRAVDKIKKDHLSLLPVGSNENYPQAKRTNEINIKTKASARFVDNSKKNPDWLTDELLQSYSDYRREIGKPLGEQGRLAMIKRLELLMRDGHSPESVINATISNGWKNLYPDTRGIQKPRVSEIYTVKTDSFVKTCMPREIRSLINNCLGRASLVGSRAFC